MNPSTFTAHDSQEFRLSASIKEAAIKKGPSHSQPVPRSIPVRPQSPQAHSSHYRSPSPSRFPRFEETSVSEKSRCDGLIQTSPAKAEARADAPESLSSHHPSCPSSESSLRHLTHQSSACPDYPLLPRSRIPRPLTLLCHYPRYIPDTFILHEKSGYGLSSSHGYLYLRIYRRPLDL